MLKRKKKKNKSSEEVPLSLKLEINFPIYLYRLLGIITILMNLIFPISIKNSYINIGAFNIFNWISIAMISLYYFKMTYRMGIRDGNPSIIFIILRVVMIAIYGLMFKETSLIYKNLFIISIFEFGISVLYIFDVEVWSEYLEEKED